MRKIVITGALGHIGSRLVREIPSQFPNIEILMIDNLITQRYCSLFNLPKGVCYKFIETDVLTANLDELFENNNVVVHLAALTDAANSFQNRELVKNTNYNATKAVAEACIKCKCKLIYVSSTSVYGTQQGVVDESCTSDQLVPQSPYAESKLQEEELLQNLSQTDELSFSIFRFGTISGVSPGMRFHTAVNKFCLQAVMNQPLTVWKTALYQKRPYLDLTDAIGAILYVAEHGFFSQNIYNVLTENLTVDSILRIVKAYVPNMTIEYVEAEIMNQLSYEVSSEKFRRLGFTPRGSLETSISETITLLETS